MLKSLSIDKETHKWGDRLIRPKKGATGVTLKDQEQEGKVFNQATKSWVDKDLYDLISQKDRRDPNIALEATNQKKNTHSLSKWQRLHSVNQYEITEKFSKKVNFEREKYRQLLREKQFI